MKKADYTPGPWDVDEDSSVYCSYVKGNGEQILAKVYKDQDVAGNWEANMHLIAAAPELLNACHYVLSMIRNAGRDPRAFYESTALTSVLQNAIRKAEGRTRKSAVLAGSCEETIGKIRLD